MPTALGTAAAAHGQSFTTSTPWSGGNQLASVQLVDATGDAPVLAKVFAGASLCLWIGVIVFGRLIPQGL